MDQRAGGIWLVVVGGMGASAGVIGWVGGSDGERPDRTAEGGDRGKRGT